MRDKSPQPLLPSASMATVPVPGTARVTIPYEEEFTMKHVIVKARKINSIASNMAYIRSTKEHPETCFSYSTCSDELWMEYAAVNQEAFRSSGQNGQCVEAHENIYVFPEEFYRLPKEQREQLAKIIAQNFKERHKVECMVAVHGSDKESRNLHVHLMYMERRRENQGEKIASRRLYFDPQGRQVHTKKEACDQAGNLLPGYSFIKKGEAYGGKRSWTAKDKGLKSNQFTHAEKIWWANSLNNFRKKEWASDMEERQVYDRKNSPYLPLQSLPAPLKYSNKEKQTAADEAYEEYVRDIKECNELRREYNQAVDEALENGADRNELAEYRRKLSAEIYQETKEDHSKTLTMLDKALSWVEGILRRLESLKAKISPFKGEIGHNSLHDKIKGAERHVRAQGARKQEEQKQNADTGEYFK